MDEPVRAGRRPAPVEVRDGSTATVADVGIDDRQPPARVALCPRPERNATEPAVTTGAVSNLSADGAKLLTDVSARNAWSDMAWTAFSALSRWRHGFESRWGCATKPQAKAVWFWSALGDDSPVRCSQEQALATGASRTSWRRRLGLIWGVRWRADGCAQVESSR